MPELALPGHPTRPLTLLFSTLPGTFGCHQSPVPSFQTQAHVAFPSGNMPLLPGILQSHLPQAERAGPARGTPVPSGTQHTGVRLSEDLPPHRWWVPGEYSPSLRPQLLAQEMVVKRMRERASVCAGFGGLRECGAAATAEARFRSSLQGHLSFVAFIGKDSGVK